MDFNANNQCGNANTLKYKVFLYFSRHYTVLSTIDPSPKKYVTGIAVSENIAQTSLERFFFLFVLRNGQSGPCVGNGVI